MPVKMKKKWRKKRLILHVCCDSFALFNFISLYCTEAFCTKWSQRICIYNLWKTILSDFKPFTANWSSRASTWKTENSLTKTLENERERRISNVFVLLRCPLSFEANRRQLTLFYLLQVNNWRNSIQTQMSEITVTKICFFMQIEVWQRCLHETERN